MLHPEFASLSGPRVEEPQPVGRKRSAECVPPAGLEITEAYPSDLN
jgi:hypothetical protein